MVLLAHLRTWTVQHAETAKLSLLIRYQAIAIFTVLSIPYQGDDDMTKGAMVLQMRLTTSSTLHAGSQLAITMEF
jgi:hypothetical protein